MARLSKPTLMPGNNDTGDIAALAAELGHRRGVRNSPQSALAHLRRTRMACGCVYSLHRPRTARSM
jgi:hypothetical protein